LRAVLQNEEEIPAIDELEDMSGDELMEYIGDVKKEKQRVMAGLDALDTQEEGYQKQIEAQNEQLGAIQEDMGKLKESTLAMEVEELQETLEKQKSQLQMLMGYSRNLKSRNEQMAERQEPLRNLVQKLNLQEKALVRFIRINYDGKFMPENAYL
jgi:chromosome segregation ATPase